MKKIIVFVLSILTVVIFSQTVKKSELYEIDINELGSYYIDENQHIYKVSNDGIEYISQCSNYIFIKTDGKQKNVIIDIKTNKIMKTFIENIKGLNIQNGSIQILGTNKTENIVYVYDIYKSEESITDKLPESYSADPIEIISTEKYIPFINNSIFVRLAGKSYVMDFYNLQYKKQYNVKMFDVGMDGIVSVYK